MKANLNNTDNNDYVRGFKDGKKIAQTLAQLLEKMVIRFTGTAEMADQDIDVKLINKCKKELAKYKTVK